jgi:hypothetical protein
VHKTARADEQTVLGVVGESQPVSNVTLSLHNTLEVHDPGQNIVAEGGWRNKLAREAIKELEIPTMAIWNESLPIWEYHHHLGGKTMHECTHSCHPSVYEVRFVGLQGYACPYLRAPLGNEPWCA